MIIAPMFALALAQAEASAPAAMAAPAPAEEAADIPKGAPSDDYGLVAWCHGALTGHMALYTLVKPELRSIERPGEVAGDERGDQAQMKAGRQYLELYRRALIAAEKASLHPIHERGLQLEAQGEAIWSAAKTADPRTRMWSWLLWDLPGRCETSAKRLRARSGLLGAALRGPEDSGPQSIDAVLDSADTAAPARQPATDAARETIPGSSEPNLRPPQP